MLDRIVAHVVSEHSQRFALGELSYATVRMHDQSAVVSQVATEVASGNLSPALVGRLDEVSSYMSRLVAEREEYARHAAFLGAARDLPGAFRLAMIGKYGQEDDITVLDDAALDELREQLRA